MYIHEHPFLQVLPVNHFDTSLVVHLIVNQESCVQWKGYQYVTPQNYMYEVCPVRITDQHLMVYSSNGEMLATHPLARERSQGTLHPVLLRKHTGNRICL